jgi:hypothetical protein
MANIIIGTKLSIGPFDPTSRPKVTPFWKMSTNSP